MMGWLKLGKPMKRYKMTLSYLAPGRDEVVIDEAEFFIADDGLDRLAGILGAVISGGPKLRISITPVD